MSDGRPGRRGSAAASPKDRDGQGQHVCPVTFCPIGLALATVDRSSPEAVGHLLVAAREFLLAAKTLIDTRVADTGGAETKLERIEIA
ncbi:MAG TPA: hypothetical protein VEN95_01780 [Actinomycetota bacterium]|jgi:hypothetical protein|nr:hypothetical protein [Actinomycetota bacterium]